MRTHFPRLIASLALAVALALPGLASADDFEIDAAHTNVGFKVSHMVVSKVRGEFKKSEAKVSMTPGDIKTLKVSATIDIASVDTDNEKRDEHLRSADFFDAATHPTMTFVSTKVQNVDDGGPFELVGNLTIKGVTKEITLKGDGFNKVVTDPWGNVKIGGSLTATINRQDFGVTWNKALDGGGVVVGDDVTIEIEAELNKKKAE